MVNKTKSALKVIAVIIVLVMILMQLGLVSIPLLEEHDFLETYQFWVMVAVAMMLLLAE